MRIIWSGSRTTEWQGFGLELDVESIEHAAARGGDRWQPPVGRHADGSHEEW